MGFLTIVFIVLKLTGYIAWSWWWVFAPLWGPFAIGASIVLLYLIFKFAILIIEHFADKYAESQRAKKGNY